MKPKYSSCFLSIWLRIRSLFILCLIFYISVIPAIKMVFHTLDEHYEICKIYEDNDLKEEEIIVDVKDETNYEFCIVKNSFSFNTHKCSNNFDPEVPQPPPKGV